MIKNKSGSGLALAVVMLAVLLLTSCGQYKKHFGGKSCDHSKAKILPPLVMSTGADSLRPTNRYSIPQISGAAMDVAPGKAEPVNILPPDYR